ncbi:metal-dependent hydrolase family protein [Alkalihalobacillus trypoxylicola]|uniref:Aryldialkylphosphatase n=1 Tax=Alkalihalobacillus trypoxylicola TaxID=519424 RepID=A0A162DG80_9BACI|nr:amidohydrolase family protein [Alkalihalobacillus trypoxylicola]KYG29524.1 aryldialkylphosphatase [Alkalihalobacillus trypoxylicola]
MSFIIKNVTLIDGVSNEAVPESYVWVEDGKIKEVGRGSIPTTHQIEVIDGSGQYLTPGLIDSHVHLIWSGSSNPQDRISKSSSEDIALQAYRHSLIALQHGITTVRDLSSPGNTVLSVRNMIDASILPGPTIVSSGPALCITGGHVHYIGMEADGAEGIRKATRGLLKQGVDVIKLMATGGIHTFGEEPGAEQFTIDELRAAKEEASKKNKFTSAHAQGLKGIENCLDVGIDTIEHGIFANEAALKRMKQQGTFLVPTMVIMRNLAASQQTASWRAEKAKKVIEPHFSMLEQAVRLGVKIATGTDCGAPDTPFSKYFDELTIMESAGMSKMAVIQASTSIAADACQRPLRGRITEGCYADLLLLKENPIKDLDALRKEKRVFKDGKEVTPFIK